MIGIELGWLGWDMGITNRCARSKGNLNRNPYCSCSHSTPIPSWTMKRNERDGGMGLGWRWVGRWEMMLLMITCVLYCAVVFIILCVCALWNWFFLFVWRLCVEGLRYRFRDIVFILVLVIMRYFLMMDLVSFEACGGYRSFNVPSVFRLSCRIHFASFVLSNVGSCGH